MRRHPAALQIQRNQHEQRQHHGTGKGLGPALIESGNTVCFTLPSQIEVTAVRRSPK